jgi:hypothetical protein
MKKLTFFIVLIILCSGAWKQKAFGQEDGSIDLDTMTIEEIWSFNQEMRSDTGYQAGAELILSQTPINSELNYGIFWRTGQIISLPRESVPQTAIIRKSDDEYVLIWFQIEPDRSFTRYSKIITAPQDTTGLSRYLTIKPLMTRR